MRKFETENVTALRETAALLAESGAASATTCFQCGICDAVCPWNLVKDFMVRRLVREAQFGLTEIESEETWQCAACGRCEVRCPRGVDIVDIMVSLRRIATEYDIVPRGVRRAAASLQGEGNPWGESGEGRAAWAKGLCADPAEPCELLYFPCCTQSYEGRSSRSAVATVGILQKAGVEFAIAGPEQACCGESIRKAGEEEVFESLARKNVEAFLDKGVSRILVSSPHCYQALRHEYAELGLDLDVLHVSEYLVQLLREGRLAFAKDYRKRVAYHDPCYLGRRNGIYDPPREILSQIPGLELVEMVDSREDSLCCGGGAGRVWMETPKAERLSDLRLDQAVETGADVLATSCPYCILHFEDSRATAEHDPGITIRDVTEIVHDVI